MGSACVYVLGAACHQGPQSPRPSSPSPSLKTTATDCSKTPSTPSVLLLVAFGILSPDDPSVVNSLLCHEDRGKVRKLAHGTHMTKKPAQRNHHHTIVQHSSYRSLESVREINSPLLFVSVRVTPAWNGPSAAVNNLPITTLPDHPRTQTPFNWNTYPNIQSPHLFRHTEKRLTAVCPVQSR